MRRTLLALSASLATLALALPAAADEAKEEPAKAETKPTEPAPTSKSIEENNQGFLGKGAIIFGAERVFGFSVSSLKPEGVDATKVTEYGFLWNGQATNVFQIPRMALDYVAFDQVTFGGSLGVAHQSAEVPNGQGGTTSAGSTNWILAPRAGYIFGGRGVLSLWLRAGFSVWSMPTFGNEGTWGCALNVEPELIISPYKHLGIYIGGVLDLGLFGKATNKDQTGADQTASYNVTNYGATAGLRAWF